jgi:hypothetical protein
VEYDNIAIHRHTDGKNDTCDTRQRQYSAHAHEYPENDQDIQHQRDILHEETVMLK